MFMVSTCAATYDMSFHLNLVWVLYQNLPDELTIALLITVSASAAPASRIASLCWLAIPTTGDTTFGT